jgi:hypothetical protein
VKEKFMKGFMIAENSIIRKERLQRGSMIADGSVKA